MQVGDVIQHQGTIIRVNAFHIDDEGVTVIDDATLLELYWPWIFENNPGMIEETKKEVEELYSKTENMIYRSGHVDEFGTDYSRLRPPMDGP